MIQELKSLPLSFPFGEGYKMYFLNFLIAFKAAKILSYVELVEMLDLKSPDINPR
jgi:hypothetical protein